MRTGQTGGVKHLPASTQVKILALACGKSGYTKNKYLRQSAFGRLGRQHGTGLERECPLAMGMVNVKHLWA